MSDDDFEDLLERLLNGLRQAEDPTVTSSGSWPMRTG
jgi:tetrahydromethanopterin S-methyltransferase subunit B